MSYPVLFPYVHPFTSCRTAMETYYITHVLKQPVNTAWPSRLEICNDITWHVSNLWKFWSLNLSFASLNLSYEHKWTKCLGATDISRACQGITCQRRSGPWQEPGQHGAGAQAAGERRTNGLQLRRPRQLANMNNSFWIPDNEEADECLYENYSVCTTWDISSYLHVGIDSVNCSSSGISAAESNWSIVPTAPTCFFLREWNIRIQRSLCRIPSQILHGSAISSDSHPTDEQSSNVPSCWLATENFHQVVRVLSNKLICWNEMHALSLCWKLLGTKGAEWHVLHLIFTQIWSYLNYVHIKWKLCDVNQNLPWSIHLFCRFPWPEMLPC